MRRAAFKGPVRVVDVALLGHESLGLDSDSPRDCCETI